MRILNIVLLFLPFVSGEAQVNVKCFKKSEVGIETHKPDTFNQFTGLKFSIHPDFEKYVNNSSFFQTENTINFKDLDKSVLLYTYDTICNLTQNKNIT